MANCKPICSLCRNLVLSQSVTFTGGNLIINIPAGSYDDCQKVCLVVAQAIPAATTINAPVVITIGDGTVQYPLTNRCCSQVTACSIRTRTRYSTVVFTNATGGTFKLLGRPCCAPNNDLRSIDGTAPATPATPAVASTFSTETTNTTGKASK